MRFTPQEIAAIKESVAGFDPNAQVYLLGSWTRDEQKGGDIDLLIITDKISFQEKIRLKLKLYDVLGEQKIDIVIPDETHQAFVKMALQEGVLL